MGWLAGATLAFLIGTFELVFRANLDPRRGFSSSVLGVLLAVYLLFLLRWLFRFEARFGETAPPGRLPRA
jgi:hypothetical protein